MIPNFSGDYLSYDNSTDGEILEIIDEGKMEFNKNFNKDIFNIKVSRNGKELIYSPTNEAGKILQGAFGKDTKDWIGEKFEIVHVNKKLKIRPIRTERV